MIEMIEIHMNLLDINSLKKLWTDFCFKTCWLWYNLDFNGSIPVKNCIKNTYLKYSHWCLIQNVGGLADSVYASNEVRFSNDILMNSKNFSVSDVPLVKTGRRSCCLVWVADHVTRIPAWEQTSAASIWHTLTSFCLYSSAHSL